MAKPEPSLVRCLVLVTLFLGIFLHLFLYFLVDRLHFLPVYSHVLHVASAYGGHKSPSPAPLLKRRQKLLPLLYVHLNLAIPPSIDAFWTEFKDYYTELD